MIYPEVLPEISRLLNEGTVIPAHPLALNQDLTINEQRQRALTRYYINCGVGGVAVGVHTTQFGIRKPSVNLLEPVLKIAADEIEKAKLKKPFIKVAGICGPTNQALKEAGLATQYGYDLGLVSMGGLQESEKDLIKHVEAISTIIPVFGFYLQPAVGGRLLSYDFWRDFSELPNVHAIKVAAFNRYQTLDVMKAVSDSSRCEKIALYTGNDDNIVADLLTTYKFTVKNKIVEKKFVGGLLGHWAVWTKQAVRLFTDIKKCREGNSSRIIELLTTGIEVTDMNAALFDVKNSFKGCIAGIHEVLRRQGLLDGIWCLNPEEKLSPGQMEEIDRVYRSYPYLIED